MNMKNEQILKKAIEKANKNSNDKFILWEYWHKRFAGDNMILYYILFDHDFAKAFWGEKEIKIEDKDIGDYYQVAWQYYLQQMVLLTDDEKFKYIEKYL